MDELWAFVGTKSCRQWVWLVMEKASRKVLAYHVGPRNKQSLQQLMHKLPEELKKVQYHTGNFLVCNEVLPYLQHKHKGAQGGKTCYIERFNCTLRQRVSYLARKGLPFAESRLNLCLRLKYFLGNYNLAFS